MNFNDSLKLTLKFEGGFSNDPADPGGATMKGVTQRTYDSYRTRKGLLPQAVFRIASDELEDLYRNLYWIPSGASQLSDSAFATCLFDFAVNSGVLTAVKVAQRVVGVEDDGVIGPKTISALQAATRVHVDAYLDARMENFQRIIKVRPSSSRFLGGWTDRVNALRLAVSA